MKFYFTLLISVLFLNACSLGDPQAPLKAEEPVEIDAGNETEVEAGSESALFTVANDAVDARNLLDLVNATDVNFFINLVKEDSVDLVEMFISSGRVEGLDELEAETGRSPLHYARSFKMASMLWNRDVVVGYKETQRQRDPRPLYEPAFQVVDFNGQSAHQYMALAGAEGAVSFAIAELCKIWSVSLLNQEDLRGRSMAHLSVLSGDTGVADTISKCRFIKIHEEDENGETSLHYAVRSNSEALVYAVLSHADMDINSMPENGDGKTPLDLAEESSSSALITILKNHFN
ncbi:MAG: ankyrin repeat domain-containing protein [Bdellovibrionales bacterium]